jgi:glycerol uptake operon antiterminator
MTTPRSQPARPEWLTGPVVPAIRDGSELVTLVEQLAPSTVFILGGSINDLSEAVPQLERRQFRTFIHIDLVKGISGDPEGLRFLAEYMGPTGVISTHGHVIQGARKVGLIAILRVFALDSKGLSTAVAQIEHADPHAVEVLPGVIPKAVAYLRDRVRTPIIAGGLVQTQDEVRKVLVSGASAVSTSRRNLWGLWPALD